MEIEVLLRLRLLMLLSQVSSTMVDDSGSQLCSESCTEGRLGKWDESQRDVDLQSLQSLIFPSEV